jgi:putative hydrolase of the HAD superfamily
MKKFSKISNIIFDIGEVLLNINKLKAFEELKKLPIKTQDLEYMLLNESGEYFKYEQGTINSQEFIEGFQKKAIYPLSNEQFKKAWCAMLEDFPSERIEYLIKLSKKFNTYILSNTNELHIQDFNQKLKENFNINHFDEIVVKAYYSNEIKLRKPNPKIYEYVLADANLIPEETLFIDDREENLEATQAFGIQTLLFKKGMTFHEIFHSAV